MDKEIIVAQEQAVIRVAGMTLRLNAESVKKRGWPCRILAWPGGGTVADRGVAVGDNNRYQPVIDFRPFVSTLIDFTPLIMVISDFTRFNYRCRNWFSGSFACCRQAHSREPGNFPKETSITDALSPDGDSFARGW